MLLQNAKHWLRRVVSVFTAFTIMAADGPPALAADSRHAGSGIHHDILGDAIDYGIVTGTFSLTYGDAQSNVAAQNATCRTQTGNDLTNPVEQPFLLARINDVFRIKGFDAHVRTNADDAEKVVATGSTKVTTSTSKSADELHAEVQALMDHVRGQSDRLAGQEQTPGVSLSENHGKVVLDTRGKGFGTIFVTVDEETYRTISSEASKLQVHKDDGQTIVFNVMGDATVLHKFDINGTGADSFLDKNAGTMPQGIVWNFPHAKNLVVRGSVTGVVLAPQAEVTVHATSSGWLVAQAVEIGNGEWHNVNPDQRPATPEQPDVPDTPVHPESPDVSVRPEPDMPDQPDSPDVPEQPDAPEQPDNPDVPDSPNQPETPEQPDMPGTPDEPERPETPEQPEPDVPEQPDTPNQPSDPNTPDTPEEPDAPSTPNQPDMPGAPDEPERPEMPSQPNVPEQPEAPGQSDTPDQPNDPGMPEQPDAPEAADDDTELVPEGSPDVSDQPETPDNDTQLAPESSPDALEETPAAPETPEPESAQPAENENTSANKPDAARPTQTTRTESSGEGDNATRLSSATRVITADTPLAKTGDTTPTVVVAVLAAAGLGALALATRRR